MKYNLMVNYSNIIADTNSKMFNVLHVFWLRCIIVFLVAIISDFCYAFYIRRTSEGRAFNAAMWSVLIVASGIFNVLSYIENIWYLPPMLAGYFIGTYLAVSHDNKKNG